MHNLWAIEIEVLPFKIYFIFSNTTLSVSASNALVNSSNKYILGFLSRERARAILCFWPPEIWIPFWPTSLSNSILTNNYFLPIRWWSPEKSWFLNTFQFVFDPLFHSYTQYFIQHYPKIVSVPDSPVRVPSGTDRDWIFQCYDHWFLSIPTRLDRTSLATAQWWIYRSRMGLQTRFFPLFWFLDWNCLAQLSFLLGTWKLLDWIKSILHSFLSLALLFIGLLRIHLCFIEFQRC